jgi:hypothetical protein
VALDSEYLPARWALAVAVARTGAIDEALRLCQAKTPVSSDHLTKARVLVAADRAPQAANEGGKALIAVVTRRSGCRLLPHSAHNRNRAIIAYARRNHTRSRRR